MEVVGNDSISSWVEWRLQNTEQESEHEEEPEVVDQTSKKSGGTPQDTADTGKDFSVYIITDNTTEDTADSVRKGESKTGKSTIVVKELWVVYLNVIFWIFSLFCISFKTFDVTNSISLPLIADSHEDDDPENSP